MKFPSRRDYCLLIEFIIVFIQGQVNKYTRRKVEPNASSINQSIIYSVKIPLALVQE